MEHKSTFLMTLPGSGSRVSGILRGSGRRGPCLLQLLCLVLCLRNAVEITNSKRVNAPKTQYHFVSEEGKWEILLRGWNSDRVWAKRFVSDLWMWGYLHSVVQCDLVPSFCFKSDLMLLCWSQLWLRISAPGGLYQSVVQLSPRQKSKQACMTGAFSSSLSQISLCPWTQTYVHEAFR